MKNNNFTQGFVESCIDSGLGLPDIKALLNKQASVDLFDSPQFTKGFISVVGQTRFDNMSRLEKAACVEQLQTQLLPKTELDK